MKEIIKSGLIVSKKCNRALKIMKISTLLFFLGLFSLTAENVYPQQTELSLDLGNVTIKKAISEIEKSSDYVFLITDEAQTELNKRTSLRVRKESINAILELLLKDTGLAYSVVERQISLYKSLSKAIEKAEVKKEEIGQQKKTITGKVVDVQGIPVIGANIIEQGTTNGTVTDVDGNFRLVVEDNAIIHITYIGYLGQEISVERNTVFNIILQEDFQMLDEVVAIGYGTARRKDLTGSVSSVSGSSLQDIPVSSAAQAIVGRMAGVQVTQTEGSPDAEIKIRIRGGGSITQDNSPLYIVDGFPVDNINDIAPTDIASIDILKDASSSAIYGARGANGVVLVTTKRGEEGRGRVVFNTYFGIKNITKTLDVLDPYEYVLYQYENDSALPQNFGNFQDYELYKQMKGTDWQDEIFGQTGTSLYHNIAFTGGTKTSKYNISITNNEEKEIMLGSGYSRTNLTANTTNILKEWLTIDLNTRFSNLNGRGAGTSSGGRLAHVVQYRPINGFMDLVDTMLDDGDYEAYASQSFNPVDQTNDDYRRENNLRFNIDGAATIKFSNNLSYRLDFGVQYNENTRNNFYGINTSNARSLGEMPLATIIKNSSNSYRLSNVLTYNINDFIPNNDLTVMVGEEIISSKAKVITNSAKYFPKYIDAVSALSMMQLGGLTDPVVTDVRQPNNLSSFFGRINYNYMGKYLASITYRADGSSKFAPGNQWGYFPSGGIAWRISDEAFMKKTDNWLSDFKLRASFGTSGNNRISDNAWQKTFSVSSGTLYLDGDGISATPTAILSPNSILSNPSLKWETTVTNNIGIDFGLFNQRVMGTVEVYKNLTKDLLISATIPSSTGYSRQWQNIGQTSNRGVEFELNVAVIEKKDFSLQMAFNIGINKNKIDKLGETKRWEQIDNWSSGRNGEFLIEEGGQVGSMFGYVTDGMYSFDDFDYDTSNGVYILKPGVPNNHSELNHKMPGASRAEPMPGALKLVDQNKDGIIDLADRVIIGNANPKHSGGYNITARYKGFDFTAFFNWVYGNDIFNANKLAFTSFASSYKYRNILNIMNSDNRFTYIDKTTGEYVNDPVKLAEINKNATIWSPVHASYPLHSWAIEDGSFLRLNNLTIGYSIPKALSNKIKVSRLRIYATAYNLLTWTNYSGFDPEVDSRRSTPLTPGIDWNAYPKSRTFNFGLNLEF